MTKQLLTALLAVGLSATAKAETVVYYCNTTDFSQIDPSRGVVNIKSYAFKMMVDPAERTVHFKGDVLNGLLLVGVSVWRDGSGFHAQTPTKTLMFDGRHLSYAGLLPDPVAGSRKTYPEGHVSKCDKF